MCHFQTIVVGHFPNLRLHPQKGRAVTHVHDDAMVQDERSREAAADAGLPWFRGGLVEHSGGGLPIMEARHSPWGRLHAQVMRESNLRERMWAFIMQGEDLPYATNTVDLSPSIRDARGFPVARVTYEPGRHELAASKYHGKILQSVLEEMGAEWVLHTSSPGVSYHGIGTTPVPESRHVIGTARMGDNPDTAVVDRWGRVHALDNVVVADSSVFVTSSGYGPTLTLVALAARAAHHLAGTKPGPYRRPTTAKPLQRGVHADKIERVWVERSAHPLEEFLVFGVVRVGDRFQEALVAAGTPDVIGRTARAPRRYTRRI